MGPIALMAIVVTSIASNLGPLLLFESMTNTNTTVAVTINVNPASTARINPVLT